MNDLTIFDFETNPVRIVMLDNQKGIHLADPLCAPHWVASDLATCLGYKHTPNMLRMLDEDQKGVHLVNTLGGDQSLSIVTEGGMWTCVIRSKRPEAKRFVRWLTDEVLPTLRRTGSFAFSAHQSDEQIAENANCTSEMIDIPRLNTALAVVREARRLFGDKTARWIWKDLGLPHPSGNPLALTDSALEDETLVAMIGEWVRDKNRFTTPELVAGIGITALTPQIKTRIFAIMRGAGWIKKVTNRGNHVPRVETWHCPWIERACAVSREQDERANQQNNEGEMVQ